MASVHFSGVRTAVKAGAAAGQALAAATVCARPPNRIPYRPVSYTAPLLPDAPKSGSCSRM